MATVRVLFDTKFCQTHLDCIIADYWVNSLSEKTNTVIFDLSLLEWIDTEEIAFLFAWIKKREGSIVSFPNIKTLSN